jgi:hypothetical protein
MSSGAAPSPLRVVALAPPPGLRAPGTVSEPYLALDPSHASSLVAVAQTRDLVAWRSEDGGATWSAARPLAGRNGIGGYAGGDPVVALRTGGSALFGGLAFDTRGKCTLLNRVGTYRSENGGRSFKPLVPVGATFRLPRRFFGLPPIRSCPLPGLTQVTNNDKPRLAVDNTGGSHAGSAYLSWSRYEQHPDGRIFSTPLFATSHDGGKSYRRPRR